jgi:hypothetical protein
LTVIRCPLRYKGRRTSSGLRAEKATFRRSRHATIQPEDGAGAERRRVGREVQYGTDHLAGLSAPAQRQGLLELLPHGRRPRRVILCWLALLLARIAENTCGATWPELRRQLDRIAVGTFAGPAGTFRQRTEITDAQQDILTRLGIDPPPRIYQLTPTVPR